MAVIQYDSGSNFGEDDHSFTVSGNATNPGNLFDNDTETNTTFDIADEYVEIELGGAAVVKEFRYFGNSNHDDAGNYKIQYYDTDTSSWIDLKTGISTRDSSWSSWIDLTNTEAKKYRVVATSLGGGVSDINKPAEWEFHFKWGEIDYRQFEITNALFRAKMAPIAQFDVARDVSISANDDVRILKNDNVRFVGKTKSSGKWRSGGIKKYKVFGRGYEIMEEEVTVSKTGASPETILDEILPTDWSRSTTTATGASIDYDKTAPRRRVVEDMLSRFGTYVVWIDPVNQTLYWNPRGERGSYATWTTGTDDVVVENYEEKDLDTLRNKVKVVGTSDNIRVSATARDSTSISNYGEYFKKYNYDWIDTTTEASNVASSLVIGTPQSNGKIRAGGSDYDSSNLVNYEITITDDAKNISSLTALIEEQTISEEMIELEFGKGTSYGRASDNLEKKSEKEKTKPGNQWSDVYDDGSKPDDGATINADYYVEDLSNISNPQGGDIALLDIDSDGDYDEIYVYEDGVGWEFGGDRTETHPMDYTWITGTKPPEDATQNAVFVSFSTPSGSEGDIWINTANYSVHHYHNGSWEEGGDITSQHQSDISLMNLGSRNFSELLGSIEQTQIGDDTVITRMIAADQIVANHINSNEITANEIDTLDLDTNEITIGQDTGYPIEFISDTYGTYMRPTAANKCWIGDYSNYFKGMAFNQPLYLGRGLDRQVMGLDTTRNNESVFSIEPYDSGGYCQLGDSIYPFEEMFANSFTTVTPPDPEFDTLSELKNQKFEGKNLPDFVKRPSKIQRIMDENGVSKAEARNIVKDKIREKKQKGITGVSKSNVDVKDDEVKNANNEGVELGHMTSYLLKVCQDQQEVIESLESRVEKLEGKK